MSSQLRHLVRAADADLLDTFLVSAVATLLIIRILLEAAGLAVEEVVERDPYPEVEFQSRRAYIFARKR